MKSLFLLYFLSAFHNHGPSLSHGRTEAMIHIHEGNLSLNGIAVDEKWSRKSFIAGLGPHERTDSGIDIYDSKGIMLWRESKKEDEITEFMIVFKNDPKHTYSYTAKTLFTSKVVIEGKEINGYTTYAELKKLLPQYNFEGNNINSLSHRGIYKKIYMYAQHDESLQHLIFLAIGLDDDNSWDW